VSLPCRCKAASDSCKALSLCNVIHWHGRDRHIAMSSFGMVATKCICWCTHVGCKPLKRIHPQQCACFRTSCAIVVCRLAHVRLLLRYTSCRPFRRLLPSCRRNEGDVWRAAIEVPVGAELEYKLVHVPAAAVPPRWEEAENHSIKAALNVRCERWLQCSSCGPSTQHTTRSVLVSGLHSPCFQHRRAP
jgi:hypothetical protein